MCMQSIVYESVQLLCLFKVSVNFWISPRTQCLFFFAIKPGFHDVFLMWRKEHVAMCKCGFVLNGMVKAHMVSEFSVICLVVFA